MINAQAAYRPVIFGEVLFDCFPDGARILGGAPFNVAWHLQAFGLQPLFISRIGDDQAGQEITEAMRQWGMDTSAIQIDQQHPTGRVDVIFDQGQPHYQIVSDCAYDYIDHALMPEIPKNTLLYYGSLVFRQAVTRQCLPKLQKSSDLRFVDVNLRAPWWRVSLIAEVLLGAQWLKLNDEEMSELQSVGIAFENLPNIVLTKGEKGAEVIRNKQTESQIKPVETIKQVDTVGAGDAFCSVVLMGILYNWPLDLTLHRAQAFATAIVGIQGAITQERRLYEQFIDVWQS